MSSVCCICVEWCNKSLCLLCVCVMSCCCRWWWWWWREEHWQGVCGFSILWTVDAWIFDSLIPNVASCLQSVVCSRVVGNGCSSRLVIATLLCSLLLSLLLLLHSSKMVIVSLLHSWAAHYHWFHSEDVANQLIVHYNDGTNHLAGHGYNIMCTLLSGLHFHDECSFVLFNIPRE